MAGTGTAHLRGERGPLLEAHDITVTHPVGRGEAVHAVSGVSVDLLEGETLGVVGESGCGKSSLGRALMQLPPPTDGTVRLAGQDLTGLDHAALRKTRVVMQMIFQDARSSLNPRRKVKDLVAEGLAIWGRDPKANRGQLEEALRAVGLDPAVVWERRPGQLSGGQCQRVCIARALVLSPRVLICDEPVSQLDVSVQAQVLNLLKTAKKAFDLSMVFIAHDLAVVKNISDRIVVMYLGKLCEIAPADALYERPAHPYTKLLLASVPGAAAELAPTEKRAGAADPASPLSPPTGCRFRTRCPRAAELCAQVEPEVREVADGHYVACHFADEVPAR